MSVARNTATLLVASILQKVIAFVYFALIARWAGVENTGTYFFALSWTLMFSVITDLGLTSVLIRESARDHARAESIMNQILTLKAPLIFLAMLLSVVAAWVLGTRGEALMMVAFGALVLALDGVSLMFYGVLRGHHMLSYEGIGLVIGQTMTLVIGGYVLKTGAPLQMLMLALVAGSAWNAFNSWRVVRKKLNLRPCFVWDRALVGTIVRSAIPFALAGVFVKIYTNADVVLLTKLAGEEAAGLYSVPYKLTFAFQFIPMAFTAALYPAMSRAYAEDKTQLGDLLHKALWSLSVIVAPLVAGIVALGPEIVHMVYGADYASSILPLQILVFTLIFVFLDFPIGSLLNGSDRQATQTKLMGVATCISVALNVALIPVYGVIGVAIASLVSHFVLFTGGLWAIGKFLDWPAGHFLWRAVRIAAAAAAMCVVVVLAKGSLPLVASIALGAMAYVVFSLLFRTVAVTDVRELLGRVLKRAV
ncbi:MAG: flippase [Patescibacteria group bacterium]|jgi:O-antigen/teichoic acid export membrane protein